MKRQRRYDRIEQNPIYKQLVKIEQQIGCLIQNGERLRKQLDNYSSVFHPPRTAATWVAGHCIGPLGLSVQRTKPEWDRDRKRERPMKLKRIA